MRVLVAGGSRVDAGKTTFSLGLVERTGAVGFKPRAGNDFWFDHDDYLAATGRGRLYGKDARVLAAASPGDREPEDVNPVHRLWRPAPGPAAGLLGKDDRTFLVDRVGERYVVNDTVSLPESLHAALPLEGAVRVDTLAAFNETMRSLHVPAQQSLSSEVEAAGLAVVESYADVARPLPGARPDAVAVVDPGRARVFEGGRYAKACEVATGGRDAGQLEERVPEVTDLLDPVERVSLPALSNQERSDPATVAGAYEHAYDALLTAAGE